ncbi:hypothetical protein [Actinophytocola sp.]|uniref:hypothetical protein n=1 Tax=Actinophytocola sp. TaxID=1872138 RepID=UPI002ED14945
MTLLRQTRVVAVCDYCKARAGEDSEGDQAPTLFADETEARVELGLDGGKGAGSWQALESGLVICPPCVRWRECVRSGAHNIANPAACACARRIVRPDVSGRRPAAAYCG